MVVHGQMHQHLQKKTANKSCLFIISVIPQSWFKWRRQCQMLMNTDGDVLIVNEISHSEADIQWYFPARLSQTFSYWDFIKKGPADLNLKCKYFVFYDLPVYLTPSFLLALWYPKFMHVFPHYFLFIEFLTTPQEAKQHVKIIIKKN